MKARFELAIVGVVGPKCVVESAGERNELVRVTPPSAAPFEIAYVDLFDLLRSLPQPEPEAMPYEAGMGPGFFPGPHVPRRRPR